MGKDEIEVWLRHPGTQWFMSVLHEEVFSNLNQRLTYATTWEEMLRAQERARIKERIDGLLTGS